MWVVGSCLVVSGYEELIGIDVYKIIGYFVQCAKVSIDGFVAYGEASVWCSIYSSSYWHGWC